MNSSAIITRILSCPTEVSATAWDALLSQQAAPTPFMQHAYLCALHQSGSALPATGWTPQFFTLWENSQLIAACPAYVKAHSYGEYVFDWAWARAYAQHGLDYYPKLLIAVPFTPVPGTRLMARDAASRALLVEAISGWCQAQGLSSAHLLFAHADDLKACQAVNSTVDGAVDVAVEGIDINGAQEGAATWMQRTTVQFHWENTHRDRNTLDTPDTLSKPGTLPAPLAPTDAAHNPPTTPRPLFTSFDDFLSSLTQEKRKKIRQERRRVADAGVTFRWAQGSHISTEDWAFFYRCYERTYLEHGNPPYLQKNFFDRMAASMPDAWVLFIAERQGQPIASSLIAINSLPSIDNSQKTPYFSAYGRYWGALERVDCLHFEACYYQPLQWCIDHGVHRFEGGAQGEHKMARALLPTATYSAHWLSHPAFADAVNHFLQREGAGMSAYLEHLAQRSPLKKTNAAIGCELDLATSGAPKPV